MSRRPWGRGWRHEESNKKGSGREKEMQRGHVEARSTGCRAKKANKHFLFLHPKIQWCPHPSITPFYSPACPFCRAAGRADRNSCSSRCTLVLLPARMAPPRAQRPIECRLVLTEQWGRRGDVIWVGRGTCSGDAGKWRSLTSFCCRSVAPPAPPHHMGPSPNKNVVRQSHFSQQ